MTAKPIKGNFLGYGSPQKLEEAIRASEAPDDTFVILRQNLLSALVCSSLPLEEAKRRMSRVITGTTGGWTFAEGETFSDGESNPTPCGKRPETHKHYLFHC